MNKRIRRKPTKPSRNKRASPLAKRPAGLEPLRRFDEVLALIEAARGRAYLAVNTELIGLYWQPGEYISKKIANAEWGRCRR